MTEPHSWGALFGVAEGRHRLPRRSSFKWSPKDPLCLGQTGAPDYSFPETTVQHPSGSEGRPILGLPWTAESEPQDGSAFKKQLLLMGPSGCADGMNWLWERLRPRFVWWRPREACLTEEP